MIRTAIVAVAFSLIAVLPAYSSQRPEALMDQAQSQVQALDSSASQVRSPALRQELRERIDRLDRLLDRMESAGAYETRPQAHRGGHARQGHPANAHPQGLSYQDAMNMVRSESFDNAKLQAIQRAARNGRFSTQQARSLAAQLSFDRNKADALIALYPSVTDKYRFSVALDILDFHSTRQRVANNLNL